MKRILISLILVVAVALGCVACSNTMPASNTDTTTVVTEVIAE